MQKVKILSIAEKIFFSKRYSDVKLDVIANELKIQKPSLYHYFKNKKELFVQVLEFSQKIYFENLNDVISKGDIKKLIKWYLEFPLDNKNIFGIASQKNYCIDIFIRRKIFEGKQIVFKNLKMFFEGKQMSDIKIYLLINLMEKIAQNNCIDQHCLQFSIDDIANEITNEIINL